MYRIADSFKKIIVVKDDIIPWHDEKGILYGGGSLNINVKMNKKWSVESGVRYARMGQKVTPDTYTDMFNIMSIDNSGNNVLRQVTLSNSMGNILVDNDINIISQYNGNLQEVGKSKTSNQISRFESEGTINKLELNIDYLEVPLTMRYYFIDNKISLSMSAGVSANFLINNGAYLLNNNSKERIGEISDISGLSMSTHAGLSFSLPIVGQLSLQVEPRVNYFVSDINKDDFQFHPYSFGVFSGVKYKFGK